MSQQKASVIYSNGIKSKPRTESIIPTKNKVEYKKCKDECVRLRDAIDNIKESENRTILLEQSKANANPKISALPRLQFSTIKTFKGHKGKIYDADWSLNNKLLLSGSQDGDLSVWNSVSTHKKCTYAHKEWIMTCSFSPTTQYIACGGLDNKCSIYKYKDTDDSKSQSNMQAHKTLHHHEGYLSSLEFLPNNDEKIITASGDSTCILWDVVKKVPDSVFLDHAGDVTTVAINKHNHQIFISGSVDATVKLWDVRMSKCCGEFSGQDADADINDICWYPDNFAFAAGSEDATIRMFDIRAYKQLNEYFKEEIDATVTSVSFSNSGRIMFVGYDCDPFVSGWDVALCEPVSTLKHEQNVSNVQVAPNGGAILTSSWDKLLRLWVASKK